MADPKASRLLAAADRMWADRAVADTVAQEIAQFVLPNRSNITLTRAKGARQTIDLFDSTPIWAVQMLASNISAGTTPSSSEWRSLKYRQDELNEDKETQNRLADCTTRMFLAQNQSNFHEESFEQDVDLVVFGTAAMFVDARPPTRSGAFGGLRYRTLAWGEYTIEEDEDGEADRLFRTFTLTAWVAREKWGVKAGVTANKLADTKPEERIEYLHAVYPNTTRKRGTDGNYLQDSANMPWASCYINRKEGTIVDEGGFHEFPYVVPRWNKVSSEVYGRSPSHIALPAIRSLNAAMEIELKSAPLKMQPPTVEQYGAIIGDLDLTPGGRNIEESPNALRFLDTRGDIQTGKILLKDLRDMILDIYYIPQLRLKESPQMTATEVMALREQLERLMGPQMGRLEAQKLNPLTQREFGLMQRGGAFLPLTPAEQDYLARGGSPDLDVQYEGPLQRSRRSADIVAIQRVYQSALSIVAVAPEVMDNFDHDEAIRIEAEVSGAPPKIMKSREAVAQIRADRAAAKQQQDQMAQVDALTKSAGQAAPAVKALGDLTAQSGQFTNGGQPGAPSYPR